MNKLHAIWILDAESNCFSEGVGLPIPLALVDDAVETIFDLAVLDYSWSPKIKQSIDRIRQATEGPQNGQP